MEWNRKIEDKLTQNWQWLMRTVMLKEIVHVLIEDKIISLDFWMNLKEKQISEQDRNANFFFEVSKFTKERYIQFVNALRKGGHKDLAEMLELKPTDTKNTSKARQALVTDYRKSNTLGPKNERIKIMMPKRGKSPEHISEQERTTSEIKRENSELKNQLTTISSHVGQLHTVTQTLTGNILPKDATFVAKLEKDSFFERIHNIEEHEKYLELQDTNLKQEMAIKHLRSEIVDLKIELNHQINQLEIKLKDAHVKKELKEQEAENLLSKVTGIKTQMNSLTKELELEREEKAMLKAESTRLVKVNEELHEKIKEQNTKVVSLEKNILQLKSETESANSEVKRLENSLVEKEKMYAHQRQENSDLERVVRQANIKTEEFANENKQLSVKVNEFEKEILDLKVKLHRLQSEKQRGKLKCNTVPSWR